MATIKEIWEHLYDTAKYHGMSFASIVQVAAEIEAVEDKDERAKLRRGFRQEHALTSQVWARVAKRFPAFDNHPAQTIRAMSYCCQLPESKCQEVLEGHLDHILEPGALGLVLADVNAELDARRNGRGARDESLAAMCADLVEKYRGTGGEYIDPTNAIDELAGKPPVAREIKRREREAKK